MSSAANIFSLFSCVVCRIFYIQAPVLQKVHSGIHHINLYPVNSAIIALLTGKRFVRWIVLSSF